MRENDILLSEELGRRASKERNPACYPSKNKGCKKQMVGYKKPLNKIRITGTPIIQELLIKTIANCYPGRLVIRDTTDAEIQVAGAPTATNFVKVIGILGYEPAAEYWKPATVDTIYKVDKDGKLPFVPVMSGPIVVVGSLADGNTVVKGDLLVPAANGEVALMPDAALTEPPTKAEAELELAMTKSVIAVAEESKAASGSSEDIMMRMIR